MDTRRSWFQVAAFLALAGWIGAAISSVIQKTNADKSISNSFDISAIQIQQLNGQVAAHVLTAIVIAGALTIPLLLVVGHSVVTSTLPPKEAPQPQPPLSTSDDDAAADVTANTSPRWAPDPTGRHSERWFTGAVWTEHVRDGEAQSEDPYDPTGPAPTDGTY